MKLSPEELQPNNKNEEIYGKEKDIDGLIESIRDNGLIEPIIAKKDKTIISGHRRWLASRELGLSQVPVEVREFDGEEDEIITLIESNNQRNKTFSQKMRESMELKNAIEEKAKKRMENPTQEFAEGETGETNQKLGERLGWSREKFRQARKIWEAYQDGNEEAKFAVNGLNKHPDEYSVNRSYNNLVGKDTHGIRVKEGQEEGKRTRGEQSEEGKEDEIESYKDGKDFVDREESEERSESWREVAKKKGLEDLAKDFRVYSDHLLDIALEFNRREDDVIELIENNQEDWQDWDLGPPRDIRFSFETLLGVINNFAGLFSEIDFRFSYSTEKNIAKIIEKAEEVTQTINEGGEKT